MFKMENISTAEKTSSFRDYTAGSVVISNKRINLNTNTYDKRKRIFNQENEWIETKILNIQKIENEVNDISLGLNSSYENILSRGII